MNNEYLTDVGIEPGSQADHKWDYANKPKLNVRSHNVRSFEPEPEKGVSHKPTLVLQPPPSPPLLLGLRPLRPQPRLARLTTQTVVEIRAHGSNNTGARSDVPAPFNLDTHQPSTSTRPAPGSRSEEKASSFKLFYLPLFLPLLPALRQTVSALPTAPP
ncbi:hypothetical protein K435DRAFT_834604 [Dendrothele bispora CBS 962.96]|uniref:Uncharacterized protein n=1 Tax=Dendrothele bispora (strain CBS 962.96) TaxID=1314807 RepID=A0A4S8MRS0_DENBC|nr:hypothetical protein K435DRAFT_834604 [Dendrothele bispora CBS 962.96]